MKPVLVLLAGSYAGAALGTWWLSRLLPPYLLPDAPFLAIVYAGLFLPEGSGLLVALAASFLREVVGSGPPWSFFLASLALYFLAREVGRRLFIRMEPFIVATVGGLLLIESASVALLLTLSGSRPLSPFGAAEEAVRIAWTALLAVPLYMDLSARWRRVRE